MDLGPAPEITHGLQAGIAAVVPLERLCGFRVDLTRRVLCSDGRSSSGWRLGVGLTIVPSRRRALPG